MATVILLDTHVVAWLYAGETGRFPAGVRNLLEAEDLATSPLVGLELQYLHEIGRTSEPAEPVLAAPGAGRSACASPTARSPSEPLAV